MREYKAKLAPVEAPLVEEPIPLPILFFKSLLSHRRGVSLAAAVQLGVCTFFPGRYAVVPVATLLLGFVVAEVIDFCLPSPAGPPASLGTVVPGRATSLLPGPDGTFASSQQLVVFNLGVQFNHPRGRLCPYGRDIGDKFTEMNNRLLERREELGLISVSEWAGFKPSTADTIMMSYYFKDVESIHKFAHEEMHRRAWDWYNSLRPGHIGIFHETFVVPAQSYETIYANCRPLMLGAGLVKCDEMEGPRNWRNTLVSADSVGLKSQWQRLNRDGNGMPRK
ncbi:hypothetical protein NOR_05951 [Metarhizium rileyi]|uniref:DUF4188 domain-containing protein n=1 Tax=Metarhizium rileyi (strain RCEF 4871) TaxID=1649241 RepID=A0A167BEK0_METRR|nr:hypothetical protein NOR_05951 [Metarhizium rileyi RCEF 4871]TWU72292.1 hypothetical protein ED733_003562 [Metarhizium rileyi]